MRVLSFFLAALSGALLVGAFPPFDQTWLVWIALVPALLGVHLDTRPGWTRWAPGYLLGLVYFSGVFWWIGCVTVVGTVLLVLYVALYPALWIAAARLWWRREVPFRSAPSVWIAAQLASLWTIGEWMRSWLFSGFGWDDLGVALHRNLPLMQGARLGGVLMLSWLIVFAAVVGARTILRFCHELRGEQKMRPHIDFGVAMLAIALLFSYGLHHLLHPRGGEKRHLRFAAIQPNIPQDLDHPFSASAALARQLELTQTAALLDPDLVLWPETPVGNDLWLDAETHAPIVHLVTQAHFSLLAGSLDMVEKRIYNAAFLFPPGGGSYQVYQKNRLVPFGEYTPMVDWLPIMRRIVPFEIDFSAGPQPGIFRLANGGVKLAPLICYEDTLADYGREVAKLDPDLLVNITNDGWFARTPGAAQHLANAAFRAVELDRPLLRCGNNGVTALVGRSGRVELMLQPDTIGVLSGEVEWTPAEATPYARYGDWIVTVSGALLALGAFSTRIERRPRNFPSTSSP